MRKFIFLALLFPCLAFPSSTVSPPKWVATHGDHQHEADSSAALASACIDHFPRGQLNTSQTSGQETIACTTIQLQVTVTYGPNPEPVETWTRVANENAIVVPPGNRTYRYGCDDADTTISQGCPAGDVWTAKRNFSTQFTCNSATFGSDPIRGVVKTCQVSSIIPGVIPAPSNGTARLTWEAPTTNEGGGALTDLAGYRILYGASAQQLLSTVELPDRTALTYTVGELSSGQTYYFTVRAYSSSGAESANANIVSKVIP